MKKDDLSISYSELMKTLDKFRGYKPSKQRILTEEQKKFLIKCREHENPVIFRTMAELWTKLGWGKMNHATMRDIYFRDCKGTKRTKGQ